MEEPTVDMNAMLQEAAEQVADTPAGAPEITAEPAATQDVADAENAEPAAPAAAEPAAGDKPADKPFAPDNALLERAVKAGLSIDVAKTFASKEAADQILSALEARADGANVRSDEGNDGGEDAAGVPGIDLTEFTEENGYDSSTVKVLNSMKSVIEAQSKQIAALVKAGETAKTEDFFTAHYNALDKSVRDHMSASRQSQLKSKFNVLEQGYRAAGSDISREDIFKEAVQLAAGDLVSKAEADSKAAAAEKRRTLAIARPGNGKSNRGSGPATEEDVAKELFAMMTT